jgi:hypothetical protein
VDFNIAQSEISKSQRHALDDMSSQMEKGLLYPCVRLHKYGTILRATEHSTPAIQEHKLKVLEIGQIVSAGTFPQETVTGLAIGDIEAGDLVYRITHVGLKLVVRATTVMTTVGKAFMHHETQHFADSNAEMLEKLARNREKAIEILSRGFREIPAHLVGGSVQYDMVLDRKAFLYFVSIDDRVMHRRWPEDGDEVLPYSDPGL